MISNKELMGNSSYTLLGMKFIDYLAPVTYGSAYLAVSENVLHQEKVVIQDEEAMKKAVWLTCFVVRVD